MYYVKIESRNARDGRVFEMIGEGEQQKVGTTNQS